MTDNPYQSPQSDLTPPDLPPREPGESRLDVLPVETRRELKFVILTLIVVGALGLGVGWVRESDYLWGVGGIIIGGTALFAWLRH